jgi:hypothetical protein
MEVERRVRARNVMRCAVRLPHGGQMGSIEAAPTQWQAGPLIDRRLYDDAMKMKRNAS